MSKQGGAKCEGAAIDVYLDSLKGQIQVNCPDIALAPVHL